MSFDWQNNLRLEVKSLRTNDTKHFPHPTEPGQMVCIQSSGLLHAFTDVGFLDIQNELPNYDFPEATRIDEPHKKDKHEIMDLPAWGDARVEDNGKTVRVYDKKGVSIYRYKDLLAVPTGEKPYLVIDKDGKSKPVISKLEHKSYLGERTEINPNAKEGTFEVADNKLYVKFEGITEAVDVFDATDKSSVNNKDSFMDKNSPDTNSGSAIGLNLHDHYISPNRPIINFTVTTGITSDSISSAKLFLNCIQSDNLAPDGKVTKAMKVTRDNWTEAGVTWNKYDGTNSWTTAGGDFVTTNPNQGSMTFPVDFDVNDWAEWDITDIINDAIDNVSRSANIEIKFNDETITSGEGRSYMAFASKEYATTSIRPRLEITYSSTSIKSINGLAVASVSKVNGLAIASVKSFNGLS